MRRRSLFMVWALAALLPAAVWGQEAVAAADQPFLVQALIFIVSLPYTLYLVFVEGQQMHLLPVPALAIGLSLWSFIEWKRQRFWTPRIIHVLAVLGLATIVMINVQWVMAGGEMWPQRYVVIAIFGLFPYIAYLIFLGPKFLGRRRAPQATQGFDDPPTESPAQRRTRAPGADAAAARRRRSAFRFVGAVGGTLVLSTVAVSFASERGPVSDPRPELEQLRSPQGLSQTARGVVMGDPEAPITIVEFVDYQCPGCGTFGIHHQPQVDSAFVSTGRARFVVYDLPLRRIHPHAFLAARATHCANDQGGYRAYQDELFRHQAEWSELAQPHDAFEGYAETIGVDPSDFRACLDSDRHADVVEGNEALADRLGIGSTPTVIVLVDGHEPRRMRRSTYRSIAATIEELTGEDR